MWRWQPVVVISAWYAGIHRVFQRAGGGEHSGQLCGRLWAPGWTDGLWIPSDDRQQDPAGVSHLERHTDWQTPMVKKTKNQNPTVFLTHLLQIHHSGRCQAGGRKVQGAYHSHQRSVLEVRGDQIQEERGLYWCDWVHQCTGKINTILKKNECNRFAVAFLIADLTQ